MSYFHGEWWIKDGGEVEFADGDTGDSNHEMIAAQAACQELSDLIGVPFEGDIEQFSNDICAECKDDPEFNAESSAYACAVYLLKSRGLHPEGRYEDLLSLCLTNDGDPREYAMRWWGWIWCKGTWFGLARWDEKTKKQLVTGCENILDDEGFYFSDDDENENPLDEELTVSVINVSVINNVINNDRSSVKKLYITLRELGADDPGSGVPERPAGPNAQLHQLDVKSQPGYYGSKLGDSAITPAKFIDQLLG